MTPPVIGLAGYMRSGKSTAAAHLVAAHGFAPVNFADALREAMAALDPIVSPWGTRYATVLDRYGYDEAKSAYPEVRRLLQMLGTEVGRNILGPDVWVDLWRQRVGAVATTTPIGAADVRFPNEARAVRDEGGEVWWIDRAGCEPSAHASERGIGPDDCDAVVPNVGTVDDLHRLLDAHLA